jgi:hypothetical protein
MKSVIAAMVIPAAAFLCLSGCDVDLFGVRQKKIGGGYVLYLGEDGGYSVIAPGASGGVPVWQIGWLKPFIVAGTQDGDWEVFDTSTHGSDVLSDHEFRTNDRFRGIRLVSPEVAWHALAHYRSQW